ncbi:MAG: hypothetical protein NW217_06680 [Hyphomicrobiaceae bacterium]|nr:hypothetical protein [Hyphomicrobiaceae bacterium]
MSTKKGRNAIIRRLLTEANAYAEAYEADVEEFQRLHRIERMQDIIDDFHEALDENGDAGRLADLGVSIREENGQLHLHKSGRTLVIRARDDMSIAVDRKVMHPDPDCPVLDRSFYEEVLARVMTWAKDTSDRPRRRRLSK